MESSEMVAIEQQCRRAAAVVAILLVFPAACCCSAAAYDVEVKTVEIWVMATDGNGVPVEGLTSTDFEVFEDGVRQATTCFEEGKALSPSVEQQSTKPATASPQTNAKETASTKTPAQESFVIFIDLYNTHQFDYAAILPSIKGFIEKAPPKAQIDVAILSTHGSLKLEKDFDRTTIVDDIGRLIAHHNAQDEDDTDLFRHASRSKGDDGSDAAASRSYQLESQERRRTWLSMDAIETLAHYLSDRLKGDHVAMAYISGGFVVDFGPAYSDIRAEFQNLIGLLNRSNIAVYSVNTRGPVGGVNDGMAQMASETGGLSFQNSFNFSAGFADIIQDLNHQYVLCYSVHRATKGRQHHIKVQCRRKGIKLRHRSGYIE